MSKTPVSRLVGGAPDTRVSRRVCAPALENWQRQCGIAGQRLRATYVNDELRRQIDGVRNPEEMRAVARAHGMEVDVDDQADTMRGKLIHHVMDGRAISDDTVASLASIDKASQYWRRRDEAQEKLDASIAMARHLEGQRLY